MSERADHHHTVTSYGGSPSLLVRSTARRPNRMSGSQPIPTASDGALACCCRLSDLDVAQDRD